MQPVYLCTFPEKVCGSSDYRHCGCWKRPRSYGDHPLAEGVFSVAHKLQIPKYCERIAVVTSETGDALQDIRSTIQNRFPIAKIFLYPALVQGDDAKKSLIKALKKADSDKYCDVIIIARGGGSIEDLNCFNDEELARTIYDLTTPIVSGVGHENDYTICDFVADDRAPTPTGAAVKVTPDKNIIFNQLDVANNNLRFCLSKTIDRLSNNFNNIISNFYFKNFDQIIDRKLKDLELTVSKLENLSPVNQLNTYNIELDNIINRFKTFNFKDKLDKLINNIDEKEYYLTKSFNQTIIKNENLFENYLDKLILVNPLNIMKKGYSLVYKNNDLITKSSNLDNNDEVKIAFYDGEVNAIIKK